jgi:Protein of unknown function (DUF4013)
LSAIDYRRALRFLFDDEQWFVTVLFVTLAMLVPLVGPIVALGFQGAVVQSLARGGAAALPPRFEIERLAEYLLRGLRLFVASLLLTLVLAPIALVILFTGNVGAVVLFSRETAVTSLLGCVAVGAMAAVFIAVMVLAVAAITPLLVRASLDPDVAAIFDFAFARDFLNRVGRETVLSQLTHLAISLALFFGGVLACFVGVFPALAFGTLVQAHLMGQLYLLYLARGGRRIG